VQALKAESLYHRDVDYLIQDDEVKIVDEFTGRIMEGRRWSEGLHQAVEAKEGVRIQEEHQTLATITLQNYFRLYEKLAGMTGTAKTEEKEFVEIYNLHVVEIPTNVAVARADKNDLIFKTKDAKWNAVAEDLVERHQKGQPVLVGTIAVEPDRQPAARPLGPPGGSRRDALLSLRRGRPRAPVRGRPDQEHHAALQAAGRPADGGEDPLEPDRGRAEEGRGAELRRAQERPQVRRRHEHAAHGHLRAAPARARGARPFRRHARVDQRSGRAHGRRVPRGRVRGGVGS